jgi:gliding motility-associated-like protein
MDNHNIRYIKITLRHNVILALFLLSIFVITSPVLSQIDTCIENETAVYHVLNQSSGSKLFFEAENAEILSENPTYSDSVVIKWGEIEGLYTISVYEISINGCKGQTYSATIWIEKPESQAELTIPNTFTPNNDGSNDFFTIHSSSELADFELNIYSRNGIRVFHSINIGNSWDGNKNGQPCIPGVYYYTITYNYVNTPKKAFGFIHLFR